MSNALSQLLGFRSSIGDAHFIGACLGLASYQAAAGAYDLTADAIYQAHDTLPRLIRDGVWGLDANHTGMLVRHVQEGAPLWLINELLLTAREILQHRLWQGGDPRGAAFTLGMNVAISEGQASSGGADDERRSIIAILLGRTGIVAAPDLERRGFPVKRAEMRAIMLRARASAPLPELHAALNNLRWGNQIVLTFGR